MTSDSSNPKLPLLPFLLADLLCVAGAFAVYQLSQRPLLPWQACLLVAFVGAATWCMLYPFIRRDSSAQAMARVKAMSECVAQINRLDAVAAQIAAATSQWQTVQEYAVRIADATKEVSTAMNEETRQFSETLQKANDAEKNHLRVEADKLRRLEVEWLQVTTRILDHIHALHTAALRSKMPTLISQIGQFQEACRDTARRVGLVTIECRPGDAYDAALQELPESESAVPAKAVVQHTLVPGISYQGRLMRKALVTVCEAPAADSQAPAEPQPESQPQPGASQMPEVPKALEVPEEPKAQEASAAPEPEEASRKEPSETRQPVTGELGL
jgi:molecular chaperone GrpE (heat shock protein)